MLNIRPVWKADELKRFGELEEKYHYMSETHSGGDTLRLVIEDGGEWVAIVVWGGACYHPLRRDEYIGWTPSLRAQRLKLIASNRRFTILAKPGERRNLASQCLALASPTPRLSRKNSSQITPCHYGWSWMRLQTESP